MVHTVGIVLHPQRDSATAIETILQWANGHGASVLGLADDIARIDCSAIPVDAETLATKANLLVSLGGDGTMLRSMRLAAGTKSPVLGVNLGKLGYLPEIDVDELPWALSAIDNRQFSLEERLAIRSRLPNDKEVTAFNDIALVRVPGDGSAAVGVRILGVPFVRYAADAVIVATPTGSTAYAFSAGGPIVSPRLEGMLVVPSSPHSSYNRALMLSVDETVTLDVLERSGRLAVEVDGGVATYVGPGDRIDVNAVPAAARVIRLGHTTFSERARRKLRVSGSAEVD
ncbi:NAD(+)/NADH kinase [Asanoa sp. WMMD1127]|uniref:NAD(+)/NADH kinase n=1 Tax=Asanoa sp. WMMD1127 TaxID=3016107 RepID=UPI002417E877|nr:NAD(+)/NADH kinase [Asanoa sp. WMMD1127]MDG4824020.1 NAD(+)/NADH kinase [Asanoa sp. WMMD1127]